MANIYKNDTVLSEFVVSFLMNNQKMYWFEPENLEYSPEENTFTFSTSSIEDEELELFMPKNNFTLGKWLTIPNLWHIEIEGLLKYINGHKLTHSAMTRLKKSDLESVQYRISLKQNNLERKENQVFSFIVEFKIVAKEEVNMYLVVTDHLGSIIENYQRH